MSDTVLHRGPERRPDRRRAAPSNGAGPGYGAAPVVIGALLLALTAFGFLLPHRHGALFPFPSPTAPVQASRWLRLLEGSDGTLRVEDARADRLLALLGEKQDGFVHGVAHGLQVTRARAGIAPALPFRLTLYQDHRLVLADPVDGERIEIEGFGPTNAAAWLRFLPSGTSSGARAS